MILYWFRVHDIQILHVDITGLPLRSVGPSAVIHRNYIAVVFPVWVPPDPELLGVLWPPWCSCLVT